MREVMAGLQGDMAAAERSHALQTVFRAVARMQRAKVAAAFNAWLGALSADQDATTAKKAALQRVNRVVHRLQKATFSRA